ncbi:MAG TPA: hypothetical protein VIX82_17810 [Solirubrobacteraceae bacterium]
MGTVAQGTSRLQDEREPDDQRPMELGVGVNAVLRAIALAADFDRLGGERPRVQREATSAIAVSASRSSRSLVEREAAPIGG